MKFIVIVLCLLAERFLATKLNLKRFQWFNTYADFFADYWAALVKTPYIYLLVLVLPFVVVISGLTYVVSGLFFGLISLILQLLIVYYCLGPNNVFFPVVSDTKDNVGEYLVDANSQVFAVIFWYLLLGVFGVIAYRLISVCKSYSVTSAIAGKVADVLDWIPARITSLFYLLVGNFQHGFPVLMQFLSKGPDNNAQLLNQCGV